MLAIIAGCSSAGTSEHEINPRVMAPSDIVWIGHELLGRPSDHSITVKAIANQAVEAYFEYGVASGKYTGQTGKVTYPTGSIEAVIDDLGANTLYYYRMRYRQSGATGAFGTGSEHSFSTKRAKNAAFVFAIQSDSHLGLSSFCDPDLYTRTMQNIAAAKPDFVFDLGDTVSLDDATESESTVRAKYLAQRAYFETPSSSAAIFLVLGNHENEEGWNLDDFGGSIASSLPILGANGRKRYFVNPVPDDFYTGNTEEVPQLDGDHLRGDYYAFEWGNALFVAIDPFWYTMKKPFAGNMGGEKDDEVVGDRWDWSLGRKQYLWLKQTLENSKAALKFVFAHQLVGGLSDYGRGGARGAKFCEWGGTNTEGTTSGWDSERSGWASPIHELLVEQHVTAFFHGHDHVYAKESLDGVIYQEVPMAANSAYDKGFSSERDSTNTPIYSGATLIANSGFLKVTVSPDGAKVEYVRSYLTSDNGTIADSYTMPGCTEDSDGDGTTDCYDRCPGDADKISPGICGCNVADTDSDDDGALDCNDGCPRDPAKTAPAVCGCNVADADTDGDRVLDCKDGCPRDPAKTAPGVCGCGVADVDSDGDGTLDCKDGCPSDPNKTSPGACGCGVAETVCADQCPEDPSKTAPGQCGCGIPDTDSDQDGTADCHDQCPKDKGKTAPGVCGCGEPDVDSDSDGSVDCQDKCPADPRKTAPGVCGCGKPDDDADHSGIMDCLENTCPPGSCACSRVAFSSSAAQNTAAPGSTIRFSANATCDTGAPSYQFRMLPPTGTWQPLTSWAADGTFEWQTVALAAGTYAIQVWVRDANSPKTFDSSAIILFRLVKD